MAFWSTKQLPPELQNLTPEQIAEKVAAADKLKADFDAATAAAAPKDAELTALKAKVAELEKRPVERPPEERRPETPPNQDDYSIKPDDWLLDPQTAINKATAGTTAIALHSGALAARQQAFESIRSNPFEARLLAKYANEVDEIMKNEHPSNKIFPQNWVRAFTYVKGTHLSDVAKDAQTQGDAFFSETGQSTGSFGGREEPKKDELTAEEIRVARAMKITPEAYLKRKKEMKFSAA